MRANRSSTNSVRGHCSDPGARIAVADGLLAGIAGYLSRFLRNGNEDCEAGGMLAGEFGVVNHRPAIRIREFIDAGPNAECARDSILFDAEYQRRALAVLRSNQPQLINIGCLHFHPDGSGVCSEGDWRADVEAVRASDTKTLVFAIATRRVDASNPSAIPCGGFLFHFYTLSESNGFGYVPVCPTTETSMTNGDVSARERSNGGTLYSRHSAARPKLLNDKRRLVAEVRAMEERYGGRATLQLNGNTLFWDYTVIESGRHFPVRVCYPADYPLHPPRIVSVLPLPHSPHQLPGNQLCWINQSGQCDWNPARDTAATCIHAAHRWFACLLVYLTLGRWPEGADHDIEYLTT